MLSLLLLAQFSGDFAPLIQAEAVSGEHDLVAILVDQDTYALGEEDGSSLTGKIYRYAQDVQQALPNTKTLILPVSATESPKAIFDVLEKLYLEGQSKENATFFLKGIVLFGEVPIPLVEGVIPFASIFPYTDLADPAFLWNARKQLFTPNPAGNVPQAEIWHGVIRGETSDISTYLDRNHEIHTQLKNGEEPYSDQVLFADLEQESERTSPFSLAEYARSEKYAEETAYLRYNKYLLAELQKELAKDVAPDDETVAAELQNSVTDPENIKNLPDIHLKTKIEQLLPEYLKAIGQVGSTLEEFVTQSGRWDENQVNTIPKLITTMDILSRETVKELNAFLEKKVVDFVRTDWQRNVRLVESVQTKTLLDDHTIFNRLNGTSVPDIASAEDCTLNWGSPRLPELNAQGVNSQMIEYNRINDPASVNECSKWGGCCINNLQKPNACQPEKAQRTVFSWGGNHVNDTVAQSANFRLCQALTNFENNNDKGEPGKVVTKDVSSVVLHDSPRPEQISNALEHPTAGHIPSDGVRFINFMAPGGNLQKVEFLNAFKFTPPENASGEEIWNAFMSFVSTKEKEIETKIIADNLLLFAEYVYVKTSRPSGNSALDPQPSAEFLEKFRSYRQGLEQVFHTKFPTISDTAELWRAVLRSEDTALKAQATQVFDRYFSFSAGNQNIKNIFEFWREKDLVVSLNLAARSSADTVTLAREAMLGRNGNTQEFHFRPIPLPNENFLSGLAEQAKDPGLPELFRWQKLNVHEKHAEAVRLFFGAEESILPKQPQKGYALSYFRSDGPENALFWAGAKAEDSDAEWDDQQKQAFENTQKLQGGGQEAAGGSDQALNQSCAPIEGVDIWKWLPAVRCWLESLKETGIKIKRICGIATGESPFGDLPARDRRTGELVPPLTKGEPKSLKLTATSGVLTPGMEGVIKGEILNEKGEKTPAGGKMVSVFLEGAGELLLKDQDESTPGTQFLLTNAEFSVPVRAKAVGEISLRVQVEGLPEQKVTIPVLSQITLTLGSSGGVQEQNGLMLSQVVVGAKGPKGENLPNFAGTVTAQVSDPSLAVLGDPQVEVTQGKGLLPVALRGGKVTLSVTMPFTVGASVTLGDTNAGTFEKPIELLFDLPEPFLNLESEIAIPLKVRLSSGRVSSDPADFPKDLEVGITSESKNLATVTRSGATVTVKSAKEAGVVHLFARAAGITLALLELQVGALMASELATLPANSLVSEFFGAASGNPEQEKNLAQSVLFSGKSGVVTSLTQEGTIDTPRAIVMPYGAIKIVEEGLAGVISGLTPLTLKIVDPLTSADLAEVSLALPPEAAFEVQTPSQDDQGFFFENLDTSGALQAQKNNEQIQIVLDGREIIRVDKNLNFQISDQRFSLEFDPDFSDGVALKLLLDHETEIGRFTLLGAKVKVLSAPQAKALPQGGFYLPVMQNPEKTSILEGASDAVLQNLPGVGWQEDAIGNLLIASGQNVGAALQHMASPILLTWGDPTLALKKPAADATGFDRTVGEEVFMSSAQDLQDFQMEDMDGDGKKDIALKRSDNTLQFLQNADGKKFRNFGDFLSFSRGMLGPMLQKAKDGFAQVLFRDQDDQFHFFENIAGVFQRKKLEILPQGMLSFGTTDLDHDDFEDLIVEEKDSSIRIFYGQANGYTAANSQKLAAIPWEKASGTEETAVPHFNFIFENFSNAEHPADATIDITIFAPEMSSDKGVFTFVSTAARAYRLVLRPPEQEETPPEEDMTDADKNGIPDRFEADNNGNGTPDVFEDAQNDWKKDSDEDGTPDYWDNLITFKNGLITVPAAGSALDQKLITTNAKLDEITKKVTDTLCKSSGCVASPINLAFLVPGRTNITQALAQAAVSLLAAGAKPVSDFANILNLASGGALSTGVSSLQGKLNDTLGKLAGGNGTEGVDIGDAFPLFGTLTVQPFVCTGKGCLNFTSTFRIYFSPTITGGTGIAICTGHYIEGSPLKNCLAVALPLLASTGICTKINESINNFFKKANTAVASQTGGQVAFVVDESGGLKSQGGSVQVKFSQGLINWNASAGHNAAPAASPGFFDRWVSAQIDEIKKMFRLPSLTLIYPKLSGSFLDHDQWEKLKAKEPEEKTEKTVHPEDLSAPQKFVNKAYDRLSPITDAAKDAKKAVESITEIYDLLRTIPLLNITEKTISISVPHMSRERLFALLQDLSDWKKDAKKELEEWQVFAAGWECPLDMKEGECTKSKLAWQKMRQVVNVNYVQLLHNIDRNIEILHDYTNFQNIVAHYDEELAKYFNGIICYVDAITDLMGGWIQKNLAWVKAWIRFYKTVVYIAKNWDKLFKAPDLAVRNCSACTADTYTTGGNTFEQFFGLLPTPPVLEFPKLPDIILDISQIKAALNIEVPKLEFYPQEIVFPQIPRLQLPRIPTVSIALPSIPLLPEMPELPRLPDFPAVPIPELPTIPPPPKLPAISADLTKVIKLITKLARLYCIYKSGLFVYAESELRPIIETLTNRPASVLLDIDFLNLTFPNISIPTVDSVKVTAQVNLTLDFSAVLDSIKKQVSKWNALIFDKSTNLMKTLNEKFDFGDSLDFSHDLPDEYQVTPKSDSELPERDRRPAEPVDPLKKPAANSPLSRTMQKTLAELQLFQKDTELVDFEQVADQLGIAAPRLQPFETLPSMVHFQKLTAALEQRKQESQDRRDQLVASHDLSSLFAKNPATKKFPTAEQPILSAGQNLTIPQLTPLVPAPEPAAASNFISSLGAPDEMGTLQSDTSTSGGTQQYVRKGIFVFDPELKSAHKVVTYSGFDDTVKSIRFSDVDQDGDEDLLILTPSQLLLKTNDREKKAAIYLDTPPEVAAFSSFIPAIDAVKNITVTSAADSVSWNFEERLNPDIAGVEIVLKNSATGFVRPSATYTKYVELLFPEYISANTKLDTFAAGQRTVNILGRDIAVKAQEELQISELTAPTFTLPLTEGFWTTELRFIMKDGTTGTFSQSQLAAPQPENDQKLPVFVGDPHKKIPIFTTQKITTEGVFDLESSMNFAWDMDADGTIDFRGAEISVGPFTKPETRTLLLSATDAGGNTLKVPFTLEIFVPDISLEEAELAQRVAKGEVTPVAQKLPFALLRERFKTWKLIKTPSADQNGRYLTDAAGKFIISDFNTSPDAIIKDPQDKIIARVSGRNGRVFIEQPGYELMTLAGDGKNFTRIVVLNAQKTIVGNVSFVADVASDVALSPAPITAENAAKFFGTTLFDRDASDTIAFRGIPGDAPSFPGGAVLLNTATDQILAMISREGDIRLLAADMNLRLKAAENPETDPVLFEILFQGKTIFEAYVRTDFSNITLHHGENLVATAVQFVAQKAAEHLFAASPATPETAKENIPPFRDVPLTYPYVEAIRELSGRRILRGFSDGSFRPEQEITRAEFTKIVLGATSCLDCTTPTSFEWERFFEPFPFPDIKFGEWYAFCISKAKKLGIVRGYVDGNFAPNQNITRAESVTILLRAAKIPLIDQLPSEQKVTDLSSDAWYEKYVLTAIDLGLIPLRTGGFVLPEEPISRGEFAFMAYKILSLADCRELDSDHDGIPDYREIAAGLDENNASDATQDSDGDGFSNADELAAGTDPRAANDFPGSPPADENNEGGPTDLCPNLPEDLDGIADGDGCPEVDGSGNLLGGGVHIFPGDPKLCGFLDFLADLRQGDKVKAAIINQENTKIFSESATHEIP